MTFDTTIADDTEYKTAFDKAFNRLVRSGHEFSADDIRDRIGMPARSNQMGALWSGALRRNRASVKLAGIKASSNKASHGSVIMVYQGVNP